MKNRIFRVAIQDPQLRVNRLDRQTGISAIVLIFSGLTALAFVISKIASL